MDQLKEFLQQASKHRFWIAIGFAALMPLIAWLVGTGALAEQAKTKEAEIKGANDGAKVFTRGTIQNKDWKDEVEKETNVVAKDVVRSWEKLYSAQEPLLKWPAPVAKTIQEWGPQYPKGVDIQAVNDAIFEYTQAYDEFVDQVYKTFNPFDTKTGEGIVAAAPMTTLLRPVKFVENKKPSLGDVWAAQRKLWIERTMFDVIARVNAKAKAKDWDSAAIKQIVLLEVANALALDQKTDKDSLEEAKPILAPGQTAPEKPAASVAAPPMGDMSGMGGGAAASSAPEPVQYVKSANKDQYIVVPVAMTVYIEQDRIPDLLVELRNSPMSIRVLDFEMGTPLVPVKKPKKGADASAFLGAMGAARGAGGMRGGLLGMGDGLGTAGGGSVPTMSMDNMRSAGNAYNAAMQRAGGGGVMRPGGASKPQSKARTGGEDRTEKNLAKNRDKNKKAGDKSKDQEKTDEEAESTLSNPYFNVVEVKIRGQARFYLPPPKSATPPSAPTANSTPPPAPAARPTPRPTPRKPTTTTPRRPTPRMRRRPTPPSPTRRMLPRRIRPRPRRRRMRPRPTPRMLPRRMCPRPTPRMLPRRMLRRRMLRRRMRPRPTPRTRRRRTTPRMPSSPTPSPRPDGLPWRSTRSRLEHLPTGHGGLGRPSHPPEMKRGKARPWPRTRRSRNSKSSASATARRSPWAPWP